MLISAQSLATFLEQNYSALSDLQKKRYAEHIRTAGDRVRGALAALYSLPLIDRDTEGVITAPLIVATPIADPERTTLGPVIKMLAACLILDPSRGIQPQEDRNSAGRYCSEGSKLLEQLRTMQIFIAPLDQLANYGITATDTLKGGLLGKQYKSSPAVQQQGEGMFGNYHQPIGGEFELS
jgi:hypothetical protein